ncbi:MAG TPA: TetR/AcrR family transcriptional regulator [Jatrophihabitans sp.]|nr:TetR/AcrR family transcriptional regulator [Jatrophihabitans sp.]
MNAPAAVECGARQRIVAAAVALFAEQGYDATSVNQVVVRAGVAKGALYHHFQSKDDLLYEVYRELVDRQLAGLHAILARGLDPASTLRALIDDLVVTTAASAAEAKVFARESHRLGDANQARVRAARRSIHDAVIELVRNGQASGDFAPVASPEMVSFTLFGVINGLPVWYRPDGPKRAEELAAELAALILAALRAAPAEPVADRVRTDRGRSNPGKGASR